MGSSIILNDTLRVTKQQGFPTELEIEKHLKEPYNETDYLGKIFDFQGKPSIRVYQQPPVRVFLVEDLNVKWIYWGLCHILEINSDYKNKITAGKYQIIHLNSPEEIRVAHDIIDRNPETNYFS